MQICTCTINDELYGVRVDCIREIIKSLPASPVPLAPMAVMGLVNLRGRIVMGIDMRQRLAGVTDPERQETLIDEHGMTAGMCMNLVIDDGEDLVSLLVDRVGDVIDVEDSQRESTPSTVPEASRKLLDSVYKISDTELLLLLDTEAVMDISSALPTV